MWLVRLKIWILVRMNSYSSAAPCDTEILLLNLLGDKKNLDGKEVYKQWENKIIYPGSFLLQY